MNRFGVDGRERAASVLVIEDQPEIVELILSELISAGFETTHANSVRGAEHLLGQRDFDVALVDIGLPDGSGLELLDLLQTKGVSAIMLTAESDRETRLGSFRAGVSDYIQKPFDPEELKYRLRVVLQRRVGAPAIAIEGPAGLRLVIDARTVSVHDTPVKLTVTQFALLQTLLERRGQVTSTDALSKAAWGHQTFDSDNYVEIQVSRIRQRLKRAGADDVIETVRGSGYVIR